MESIDYYGAISNDSGESDTDETLTENNKTFIDDGEIEQNADNKAKGRISKWVFQESKACQNFRKTNISYPLIHKRAHKFVFRKFWRALLLLKHPF